MSEAEPQHRSETLSVLVPCYNERYTVAEAIERLLAAPLPQGVALEVIAVDDGSTDGSDAILARLAREHGDTLQVVSHERNRGKGAAVRTALEHATGTICVIHDADLEYDARDLAEVVEPILDGEADAVFGSRFAGRRRRRVLYFWHAVGNRLLTTLSNLFTNLNLTDLETCTKAVRADVLKSIPIRCDGFGIECELTAKLAKRGCRIFEVPVSYRGRSYDEGKKITWVDGLRALWVIFYFWLVDDIYGEQYGHAILHSLSKTHRFNRWMADTIRPWVGDSVLEIGAGLGNLSQKLLPRERYTASDVDPLHLQFLENLFAARPNVDVATVNLESREDFERLARRFDTIVCLNVLEHVDDDLGALRNMRDTLEPGGRAIVLVPRGQWLFGTLDEVLEHRRRYSRASLRARCEEAGLEVETIFTFNRVSVFPWFFNGRILRRKHFGRLQLKGFDSLVWLFRRLDWFLPWGGLSVVTIARRKAA